MSNFHRSLGKSLFGSRERAVLTCALGIGVLVGPVAAEESGFALLDGLERGLWEVRYRDGTPARRICVHSGHELIHLKHAGAQCSRPNVEVGRGSVTVQYSCRGSGFGRTTIRQETRSLVQIQGNGVEDGSPYQFVAEARRVGACT